MATNSVLERHPLELSDLCEMRYRSDVTLQSCYAAGDTRIFGFRHQRFGEFWIGAEILNRETGKCLVVLIPENREAFVFASHQILLAVWRRRHRRFLHNMRVKFLWRGRLQERSIGSVTA